MEKEDKFLLSMAEDKMRRCDALDMPTHTPFLDVRQQSLLSAHCKALRCDRFALLGGYADAERRVLVFLPPDAAPEDFADLAFLRVQTSSALPKPLTHRDYLGALMGLGLRRETIGDILVRDDGADLIVLPEVAPYLLSDFRGAGRAVFICTQIDAADLLLPQTRTELLRDTVPSLRLDCMIASAFRLSRSAADEAIRRGLVFVNGAQSLKPDAKTAEGDRLVLRGSGKAVFRAVSGVSKKNRLFVEIEKYIG